MRKSIASIALIWREAEGNTLWLARWNSHWNAYAFVGGHKRENESFRECMVREVAEELDLSEARDFAVVDQPVAHLEYEAWSESARERTAYSMELFRIELCGEEIHKKVNGNPANRWLTEDEIQGGRASDGKPVSPTMPLVMQKAGLLRGPQAQRDRGIDSRPGRGREKEM